jgi:precorrin-2/cobalt-factor-2 C20-methyltransferase
MARDETMSAIISGLGMGPGDPELVTLKALRILQAADVVAYPKPENGQSFVRSIAAPHLSGTQEELQISVPMVPADRFPANSVYDRAAEEIAAHANAGKRVAVLCEGDPFFYGSFMYLFTRLAERFDVEVVPGVSSLAAGAAALGLPLAERNETIVILPAPLEESVLEARLATAEVAVIMKIGRHLPKVRRVIERLGLAARAHYIERASLPAERTASLVDVTDETAPYFSLIYVMRA